MKSMGISEFKATCIAALKEVQVSREPLIITHRGRAIARIEPVLERANQLGTLRHLGRIKADLVLAEFPEEWEMERT